MKNTRLIRTIFFTALLVALLFAPTLAQSAVEDSKLQRVEQEAQRNQHTGFSETAQSTPHKNEVVLYQRVIAELVKTFYIA